MSKISRHEMGPEGNNLTEANIKQKFSECFQSIRKLKDLELKINIDLSLKPAVQSQRKFRFGLKKEVEDTLTVVSYCMKISSRRQIIQRLE